MELSDVVKFYIKQRKPFKYQIEQLQESYKPCMCGSVRTLFRQPQAVNCPRHGKLNIETITIFSYPMLHKKDC